MKQKYFLSGCAILLILVPNTVFAAPKTKLKAKPIQKTQLAVIEPVKVQMSAPIISNTNPVKGAITLNSQGYSNLTKELKVKNTYNFAKVKANSKITIENNTIDFKSFLENSQSIHNLGSKLNGKKGLVSTLVDDPQILEIDEGILVRSGLAYTIAPGTCSDPSKKAELKMQA